MGIPICQDPNSNIFFGDRPPPVPRAPRRSGGRGPAFYLYKRTIDFSWLICNNGCHQKEMLRRWEKLAGNEKSGKVIAFRMTESELSRKIDSFRDEYGNGSKGMVTWERFCAYLGYSLEEVKECYQRGLEKGSAYGGRSKLLERFLTECRAMMVATCDTAAKLNKLVDADPLRDKEQQSNERVYRIEFGNGDKRSEEARK